MKEVLQGRLQTWSSVGPLNIVITMLPSTTLPPAIPPPIPNKGQMRLS